MKIRIKAFALAGASLAAVSFFLWSILAYQFGWGDAFVPLIANAYIGFELTPTGIVVGTLWCFLDVGIGCAIFAWLYNRFAKKERWIHRIFS